MIVMNVVNLRKTSGFVKADVCCRVVLNALFSYSSMALVAATSAFIIYAVNVMRDALREGLLNPRKEVLTTFLNVSITNFIFINLKRRITWQISTKG